MRTAFLPHPCSGRVRAVSVPDSERELKSLKISLKICPSLHKNPCIYRRFRWRRGSESVALSVVSALKMPCFEGESSTTQPLPSLALSLHPLLTFLLTAAQQENGR